MILVVIYYSFFCLSICIISLISVFFCFGLDFVINKVSVVSLVLLIIGCLLWLNKCLFLCKKFINKNALLCLLLFEKGWFLMIK